MFQIDLLCLSWAESCYLTAGYGKASLAVPWETVLDFNFHSNEFR